MQSSNAFVSSMVGRMYSKFEKYWCEYNIILAIVVILDPRYKVQFVEAVTVSFMVQHQ